MTLFTCSQLFTIPQWSLCSKSTLKYQKFIFKPQWLVCSYIQCYFENFLILSVLAISCIWSRFPLLFKIVYTSIHTRRFSAGSAAKQSCNVISCSRRRVQFLKHNMTWLQSHSLITYVQKGKEIRSFCFWFLWPYHHGVDWILNGAK